VIIKRVSLNLFTGKTKPSKIRKQHKTSKMNRQNYLKDLKQQFNFKDI